MPTCECGHKESGRYFLGKVCPKCNKAQFSDTMTSVKNKPILFSTEKFVKQEEIIEEKPKFNGLLSKSEIFETEEMSDYSIPKLEPDLEKLEKIGLEKITLSVDDWKLLTIEIYGVANEMLFDLNPEYYTSKTARKLRDLNVKLSAIVLSSKKVNPMRILLFTNLLYILPALKGLVTSRKKEKTESKETTEKTKRKKIIKDSNEEFYSE